MKVYINVKNINNRKKFLDNKEFFFDSRPQTLRELLEYIVTANVNQFNNRNREGIFLTYLTNNEVENQLAFGKVSFNEKYNLTNQDLKQAIENAILSFQDGIFRVLIGSKEIIDLDEQIELNEEDILTFIRLTMLTGRLW